MVNNMKIEIKCENVDLNTLSFMLKGLKDYMYIDKIDIEHINEDDNVFTKVTIIREN